MIKDLFNLHEGEETNQKTLEIVKNNISFTGSNLWILVCAIMVASVGLNVNSTAVVIGAMLISPLMGPIVGAGFALGVYDFILLKKSLKNLLIATIASLIVATIYFYLSPFKEVQSELLARTSPNIYDVLIAFFGGLAGVIAITRVEKGNPIPGVAIATALMPPLCTAGYGLATGNYKFFIGALFLYCINCVFICIATFSIVKYLNYPASKQVDIKHQKQVKYGITAIVLVMLIPSSFFAYNLYKEQHFKQDANLYIEKEFVENGNTLVFKKINYNVNPRTIELAFLKKNYSENEIIKLNSKLEKYGLQNTKLLIKQNSSDNLQNLKNDILNEVNKNGTVQNQKDVRIAELEQKLLENTFDNKQLFSEIKTIFPNINSVSLSNQNIATTNTTIVMTTLFYNAQPKLIEDDKVKLKNWLQEKYKLEKIILTVSE
ncbi:MULTISPECIES: TIGR00341 family protein [unclassified Flavobacterium]|uniref:TIGR00341 family protein n=1 Tax=unclassified Flavobacterium TaxID=196869 RepID=UPI00131EA4AD|nr:MULTISPECIES: TIGR00341 family protein [unclassified Flavobacterium]